MQRFIQQLIRQQNHEISLIYSLQLSDYSDKI